MRLCHDVLLVMSGLLNPAPFNLLHGLTDPAETSIDLLVVMASGF